MESDSAPGAAPQPTRPVADLAALTAALAQAGPGDVIELAPGVYRLERRLKPAGAGEPGRPIVLRAPRPGSVRIESATTEALVVARPYWLVENLHFVGICASHDECEHAIHVTGAAAGFVLRNSTLEDFNAALKVNGAGSAYPDFGLIQHNLFFNNTVRRTDRPVTPIDIVAADGWQVIDNRIADFAKPAARGPSYGVFMKGGGRGGRIARNLIVCRDRLATSDAVQVGLSFGGGGTDRHSLRPPAGFEHDAGSATNNLVARCSDVGIDVHRASHIHVAFNTLQDTRGIEVRQAPASAAAYGNLLDGALRTRGGGRLEAQANQIAPALSAPAKEEAMRPAWPGPLRTIPALGWIKDDACRRPRSGGTPAGALASAEACARGPGLLSEPPGSRPPTALPASAT